MIKHHPKFELIQSFVNGDLPASLSAGIAMHAEMCPQCSQKIAQLTEQVAEISFEESDLINLDDSRGQQVSSKNSPLTNALNVEDMIEKITLSEEVFNAAPQSTKTVTLNDTPYKLPKALHNMSLGKAANIGKLSRSRVQLNEDEIHTSLLHISPGGGVPEHTHKGFELTLLLEGSFEDQHGEYVKGDFIMLDSANKHTPVSAQGCLCYTVANDALHFTQGINRLLNPIGNLIY
ncbi:ChrR family anti-sigma-E factor [Paraglaciecola sp.]|uniref:ChrR family anti-sigma-E factor n=1 Tax=Paraglaciecola sp. TaxID=1920173 RepID=UPI003EFAB13E